MLCTQQRFENLNSKNFFFSSARLWKKTESAAAQVSQKMVWFFGMKKKNQVNSNTTTKRLHIESGENRKFHFLAYGTCAC